MITAQDITQFLSKLILSVGMWQAYLIAFTFLVVANLFCIPVSALTAVLLGALFGVFTGSLITVAGITVGASMLFLATRYFGTIIKKEFRSSERALSQEFQQFGWPYLLILHVLPATPTCLVTIAAALSPMRMVGFVVATALGLTPGIVLLTVVGDHIQNISTISSLDTLLSLQEILFLVSLAALLFCLHYGANHLIAWYHSD